MIKITLTDLKENDGSLGISYFDFDETYMHTHESYSCDVDRIVYTEWASHEHRGNRKSICSDDFLQINN